MRPSTVPAGASNRPTACGMRFVSTGARSCEATSRPVTSPEPSAPSYAPLRIIATSSSGVFATRAETWQPVARSNGVTQSTAGSLEPSST